MAMQDHDSPARLPRQLFQPPAQIQFLRREQFVVEPADFPERRRLDKNE